MYYWVILYKQNHIKTIKLLLVTCLNLDLELQKNYYNTKKNQICKKRKYKLSNLLAALYYLGISNSLVI